MAPHAQQMQQGEETTPGRKQRLRERLRQNAVLDLARDPLFRTAATNMLLILTW